MRTDTTPKNKLGNRSGQLEQLENRLVMSANPLLGPTSFDDDFAIEQHVIASQPVPISDVPDFTIDNASRDPNDLIAQIDQIADTLAANSPHELTGLNNVRDTFGFTGRGQTVAVIDTGIAYDHFALGGGFGEDFRVVGGFDFTIENDADPFDDGPRGGHGTNVAGIIGADDAAGTGVAPGVDLVALRVFDDAGNGRFSYVERALQFVIDNQHTFENPITTVNLSLGVASVNANSVPAALAGLEDEFQQLEEAGIFISVSAGNSFGDFGTAGLSYPAVSPFVVPVASVDQTGLLSSFSQRNSRIIAAPGRNILSTVPDFAGNNNGIADDYRAFSGTSQASPYVAGASVLIREAFEFVGETNITQDRIYDHIISTADRFFDQATQQFYNRLNIDAAISAIIPEDDFGSSFATAHDLGTVGESTSISGAITTLSDSDFFTFTAASSGTATFDLTNTTHDIVADWAISDSAGTINAIADGSGTFTFDIVAGQEYTIEFTSTDGLGYYDFDLTTEAAETTFTFVDWGSISFAEQQNIAASGEDFYRVQANSAGFFTTEAFYNQAGGQVSLELYNSDLQLIDTGSTAGGTSRIDAFVSAGEELFIKVVGSNSDVDFRLNNLVSLDGTTVNVAGTSADDTFAFAAGSTHQISVNGTTYDFSNVSISAVNFDGGSGDDSITLTGTSSNESVTFLTTNTIFSGSGFRVTATNTENTNAIGGGGNDVAQFFDSVGDDTFDAFHDRATLTGTNYTNTARDFGRNFAFAFNGGNDVVNLYDSAGNDRFVATPDQATLAGNGFFNIARGFESANAISSNGGIDTAIFFDSAGDDTYNAFEDQASLSGDGFNNQATGFVSTIAFANSGGNDVAQFFDSAGDDTFDAFHDRATLRSANFSNTAHGFGRNFAFANNGGNDVANLHDSAGSDRFFSTPNYASLTGVGFLNFARGFDTVNATSSNGGIDTAIFIDSAGNDTYTVGQNRAALSGDGFNNQATGFQSTIAFANNGGNDTLNLTDSSGDDALTIRDQAVTLVADDLSHQAFGFEEATLTSENGGVDSTDIAAADSAFDLIGDWV